MLQLEQDVARTRYEVAVARSRTSPRYRHHVGGSGQSAQAMLLQAQATMGKSLVRQGTESIESHLLSLDRPGGRLAAASLSMVPTWQRWDGGESYAIQIRGQRMVSLLYQQHLLVHEPSEIPVQARSTCRRSIHGHHVPTHKFSCNVLRVVLDQLVTTLANGFDSEQLPYGAELEDDARHLWMQ